MSLPCTLNWYNSWDVSVAVIAQLTYCQQGLMRPLCFLAVQPALSHPAVITQWLQMLQLTQEHAILEEKRDVQWLTNSCRQQKCIKAPFLEELPFREYRRHHLPAEEAPQDSSSSINESIGSYVRCSGARTIKRTRTAWSKPAQINCKTKDAFSQIHLEAQIDLSH